MAFETHMKNQESERVRTPEEQEKELRAKMFKGLLAVGAGVLWSGRPVSRAGIFHPLSFGSSESESERAR